jgi:hypothetical protein
MKRNEPSRLIDQISRGDRVRSTKKSFQNDR